MIKIGTIEDVFDVGSSKRVFESQWTKAGVPFYRAREVVKLSKDGFVENELFISEEMYEEYCLKFGVPKAGDILVTGVGTLGVCYQVKENDRFYFKDGNILWLKNKGNVDSKYIEYCYKSSFVRRQIESTADAAVVGTYTISNAKKTKIPLPPLEQQKKIAAILDEADAYRQKTKALIAKYDELTQSLFLDMFGDPVKNDKGFRTILGNEIFVYSSGKFNPTKNLSPFFEYATYGGNGVTGYSKDYMIDFQTIIIGRVGAYCGSVHLSTGKIWVTDNAIYIKEIKKALNLIYAYYFFENYNLNRFADYSGQPKITQKPLESLKFVYPEISLQNQFAERVQAIEVQKAQAQASLEKAEDLFNSLMQRAFKGELV
jgi:type I restriction enzyme S subunit